MPTMQSLFPAPLPRDPLLERADRALADYRKIDAKLLHAMEETRQILAWSRGMHKGNFWDCSPRRLARASRVASEKPA